MNYLVYAYYPALILLLLWGAKLCKFGEWNDEFMSLNQTKALQGITAVCIMFHHVAQKRCAMWIPMLDRLPGLEMFVPVGYWFVSIFVFCSGFGLYKSWKSKENYLSGFFRKRMLPIIICYYVMTLIWFVMRKFVFKQPMNTVNLLGYLFGLKLTNPYGWYAVSIVFFYLAFYLSFKFIKPEWGKILGVSVWTVIYTAIGAYIGHCDWWMCGEWWYNSMHFFVIGLLFAKYESSIVGKIKRLYLLYVILAFAGILGFGWLSMFCQWKIGYYVPDFCLSSIDNRLICVSVQWLTSCAFVFFVFMLGMKIRIGNRALAWLGGLTLEIYLGHSLFAEFFAYKFGNLFLEMGIVLVLGLPFALLLRIADNAILGKKKK